MAKNLSNLTDPRDTPGARIAQLSKVLAISTDASEQETLDALRKVVEALDLTHTPAGEAVIKQATKLLMRTADERREDAIINASSEYRADGSLEGLTSHSAFVNLHLRDAGMPLLTNAERERYDVMV